MKDIEQFFYFPNLKLITNKTNAFSIRNIFLQPVLLLTIILKNKNDDFLSSITLNNNAQSLRRSIRICYTLNIYDIVAHHLALSAVSQSQIYKSLSYNQSIQSL